MMQNLKEICCKKSDTLIDVLLLFNNAKKFNLPSGIALVLNENEQLVGTITEGDVRRSLIATRDMLTSVSNFMEPNPITFKEGMSISEILEILPNELLSRNRKASKYLGKIIFVDSNNTPVKILDYYELLEQKVASHRHLVIIGLGYVGLTMALVMADAGFMVTGVEVDEERYQKLKSGISYIHEIGLQELLHLQLDKNFFVSKNIPTDGDVFIISVGTPVHEGEDGKKLPILDFLLDACNKVAINLKNGNLVILRSTVPIGTCRNVVMKRLEEKSGLRCGIDFHLAFAPERTAEGKALKELRSLPQIIGGYNKDSTEATTAIFRDLTPTIIRVDSLETAEMAKLMNNTFRDYVFAYSNHMAQIANEFNINIFDAISAANEGYVRDHIPLPSPGVGGPCLTKDPHIFASVADNKNLTSDTFIKGRQINESMHQFICERVIAQLQLSNKKPEESKILICGLAFKGNPETGDLRNSTSIEIANLLKFRVKSIFAYDAVAVNDEIEQFGLKAVDIPTGFHGMDAILFLNNHKVFEKINIYEMMKSMNSNPVIFDGWNLLRWEDVITSRPSSYLGLSFEKNSLHI